MQQRSVTSLTQETGLRLYIRPFLENDFVRALMKFARFLLVTLTASMGL